MYKMDSNNNPVYLPLELGKRFLEDHSLYNVIEQIRNIYLNVKERKHRNIIKGLIVTELEKNNLLNVFIEKHWNNGKTKQGKGLIRTYKNAYESYLVNNPNSDEMLNYEQTEDILPIDESRFAYETDLRDYLVNNLPLVEPGLKLYVDDNNNEGVEYSIDDSNKRIDILAIDRNNIPVVIELKVNRGYEKVIWQCQYYKNRVRELLKAERVRVIIIAREITNHLKVAVSDLPDFDLYEYILTCKFNKINHQ